MKGEPSCSLRDLPLTLTLSQGRGKAALPEKKSQNLSAPLLTHPIIPLSRVTRGPDW